MQTARLNPLTRDDTFLGVCQAIGDDFGFNPIFLRLAFALPLLYAPVTTLAAYFALGVVVLASRLLSPNPRQRKVESEAPAPAAQNDSLAEVLAAAA